MNIVRGVAGLLRRSSDSSNASRNSESVSVEETQQLLEENHLAEIEFSSDRDEEQQLGYLWEQWIELSQKLDQIEAAEQARTDFLKLFIKTYESWVPEKLVLANEQNFSLRERCIILGCKSGHPTKVIAGLINELRRISKLISEFAGKAVSFEETEQVKLKETNDLLHVLEILARAAHNRRIFRAFEGLQMLIHLMKAILVQMRCIVGSINNEKPEFSLEKRLLFSLQGLLTHIIGTISHFVERDVTGAFSKAELESPDHLSLGDLEGYSTTSRKEGAVLLMETGGLNWFVELLRIMHLLRESSFPLIRSVQQLTLVTIKAALEGNLRAQNHFRSIGGIDVLLDDIGPPLSTMESNAELMQWWSDEDFQMQAALLEVLREAVFRNLGCLQFLFQKGGIDKFVGALIWSAFKWPMMREPGIDTNEDTAQGWNEQVSHLCRILCSFLVPSGDIRGFAMGLSASQDLFSKSGSYWELALRWIVKVLLGIFKGMDAQNLPRSPSSTLQHYVLHVFKKLLAVSHVVLIVFHEEGVWEVMFSKYFFYFGMNAIEFGSCKKKHSVFNEEDTFVFDIEPSEHGIDSEPLRLEVISLTELAATANNNEENRPECGALLKALEVCADIPSVSTMIVKSLHRILQLAPDQTVCAFKDLEALLLLSQVMDIQLQECLKTQEVDDWNSTAWKLSRKAVFDLFAEYALMSEDARIVSLHSPKTMQVIFDLLWDPTSRTFALAHVLDLMKLAPTSGDDQRAKLELCIKYLESLSRSGFDGKPKDIDVLLDLLSGIREVLETDRLYYQSLFQEAECFVHIVSLLNENLCEEHGQHLCVSVIQTLRLLLSRNSVSKNAFKNLVGSGYTTLQTLVLSAYQGSPTEELLHAILDLLVDSEFTMPGNMVIQNPDAILLFFGIVQKSCEILQLFGLLTFKCILEESIANKIACVNAGLLAFLLDWFDSGSNNNLIPKLANLIEIIGRHSVSARDLRKIFFLLRNTNQSSKLSTRKILLDIVQGMLKEDSPSVFFEMSGNNSGIIITNPLRLPNLKGFSFSCWMCMELFPTANDAGKEESMGLFTFLTENGKGINAVIGQKCLMVQVLDQKNQLAHLKVEISLKRWCHLCITHSAKRTLSSGNVLKVFVDGKLAANDNLRYPKLNEPFIKASIGASSHYTISEGLREDIMFSSPFCGQLGPIYLFDDSLSPDQVSALFKAGSSYMYAFLPTEIGCIPNTLIGNSIFDVKEGLASKTIFGFNAQGSFERTVHDITHNFAGTADEAYNKALMLDGSQLCHRHLLKDILDCVGGVCVFFLLLTQLDQPVSPLDLRLEHEGVKNTEESLKSNVYVAAEVVELIALVLENNFFHQQYMQQSKGLSVLGFLLQSISPQHLTTEVALSLSHLLAVSSKNAGKNLVENLLEETLSKIFLNLFIWIYTPYMVQRELLMALLTYCEGNAGFAPSYISLARILDLVQKFYWDKTKNRKIAGSKRILHPVTKEVIGERPSQEEIGKLRILLLSLCETAVRDSISMADTKVLLACISNCEDPVCLEDVLHMLLRLLGHKEFAAAFTESIQVLGGCQLFLGLLERSEETLRLLGLHIIGLLVISVPNEKKGSWLLSITTGVTRPALEHQKAERAKANFLFAAITEKLIAFPFTDMLCATLFDVLLGGASLKQVLQRGAATSGDLSSPKDSTMSSQIVLPQAVGILMKLLLVSQNLEPCMAVLRDILRLLEANPSSSEAVVVEPSWQCWFFDLLIQSEETDLHLNVGEKLPMLKEKESLIYNIFTVIHCFCIYRLRGGWRHLERTINFVHVYAEQGLFAKYNVLHRIYADLLEAFFQTRLEDSLPMSQPCRDNTLYVMNLLDELLIEEAIQIQPFPKDGLAESSREGFELPWLNISMETRTSAGDHYNLINEESSFTRKESLQIYNRLWDIIRDIHGKLKENDRSGPSFSQRARGLVESINLPAAEIAAAVVSGGLGAVVSMNPSKLIDKAIKLRGDKFPRVVFHLVMMYIYTADLESASSCVHQFLSVLSLFLSNENEQCKNRLQLFLWCLLEARIQLAPQGSSARYYLISQLLRETMDRGKNMLAASMTDNENSSYDAASVQSLLQQDRITNAVKEETIFLRSTIVDRSNEVKMLKTEMEEAEELMKSNARLMEDQLQSSLASLCANDMARITAVELRDEEEQQAVTNQWCHLFRHLTDERGPWSTFSFPRVSNVSWKLDKTEDPWRRRLKLRKNYCFDKQKVIAQVLEAPNHSSCPSGQAANLETLLEASKLSLKGLRGISEEEMPDPTEEGQTMRDEDDADVRHDIADGLEPVKAEHVASSSTTEQSSLEGEERFVNEVLHSNVCVLVSPKRKLAGRLEVTADSIHFHGEFLVEGTGGSSVFTSSGQINHGEHIALDLVEQRQTGCKENIVSEIGKTVNSHESDHALPVSGPTRATKGIKRHRRWELLKVKAVHGTRYLLQYTALEIFFDSSVPPVFFNFPSQKLARDIGTSIVFLRNNSLAVKGSIKERPENKHFVDKRLALELAELYKDCWRRREMNNFEYLMHLNTLAGRTYNDLTQYPVFPWIIADYSSEGLNLSSSSSFRDLSKPVGALDERRFEIFEERFHNFTDPDIPSFYYGSHYSSMGIVLFYLLRLEPFTSLHQNLQGGKFDHADRLFHSIEGAFKNCMANTSDVKELIPEFFYMPEFLVNSNNYYMGTKQDGEQLNHVVLPLWAKGSPEEFVLRNREALESEYVSQHLHQWIDLIFGYKQRGRPAVEAANVFYHLTYEGAVDLESIEDRLQCAAVEDQIANFGQTPMQLFRKKHPRRGPAMPIARPLYYAPASITLTSSLPASVSTTSSVDEKPRALHFVGVVDSKVVLVTDDSKIVVRNWLTASQAGGNFTFSSSQDPFFAIGAEIGQPYRIKGPLAENMELSCGCFQTVEVQGFSYLVTCGFWDNSFRIMSLSDGSLQSYKRHKDVVSCIAVSKDGTVLVTGSHDTTVMVWEMNGFLHSSRKQGFKDAASTTSNFLIDKPRHVLSGHDDIVTCVAISVELDLVVSGSKDASCMLHTLWEGRYVRSLVHPFRSSISRLVLSKHGFLVLFSMDDLLFLLYSINGKHLASSESNGRINCVELSGCEEFLVCGGDQGHIMVRSIYTLEVIRRYEGIGIPMMSLSVTPEDCFLSGLQDGSLLVYSIERQQQKKSNLLQAVRA